MQKYQIYITVGLSVVAGAALCFFAYQMLKDKPEKSDVDTNVNANSETAPVRKQENFGTAENGKKEKVSKNKTNTKPTSVKTVTEITNGTNATKRHRPKPQPQPRAQTKSYIDYIRAIDDALPSVYARKIAEVTLPADLEILFDYTGETAKLIAKLLAYFTKDEATDNMTHALAKALRVTETAKYTYGVLQRCNRKVDVIRSAIQEFVIIFGPKNMFRTHFSKSNHAPYFAYGKNTAARNTRPYGLETTNKMKNTGNMMKFLQCVFAVTAWTKRMCQNSTSSDLLEHLDLAAQIEGDVFTDKKVIDDELLLGLYNHYKCLAMYIREQTHRFVRESDTIELLNLTINLSELQSLFAFACNAFDGQLGMIELSQYNLRLHGINSLYDALDYYFTKKGNSKSKIDTYEELRFTQLPEILVIKFHKRVLTDGYAMLDQNASLGAVFSPHLYLLDKNGKQVNYVFRAAICYNFGKNNKSDLSENQYEAIVMHNQKFYVCNDYHLIMAPNNEIAEQWISLYGIVWIYEQALQN